MFEAQTARIKAMEEELKTAAETATFPLTQDLQKVEVVYASTWSTQTCPSHYAKGHAESILDEAIFNGLIAEVRTEGESRSYRGGIYYQDYAVWAATSLQGWRLLRYKPKLSLCEWVRLCWKRGVNPRVYNPFLPVGYEEKVGLDFFGGEFRKEQP